MSDTDTKIALARIQFSLQAVRNIMQNSLRAPLIDISVDDTQPRAVQVDIDIAAQYVGTAMDELEQAYLTIQAFLDPEPCSTCGHGAHETCSCRQYDNDSIEDPEPHGSRDTFVPHPTNPRIAPRNPELSPVCPSCHHDLELNADMRCVRCGSAS